MITKPKTPCMPNCPNRSTYCRKECEEFKAYEIEQKLYYESKTEIYTNTANLNNVKSDAVLKHQRKHR